MPHRVRKTIQYNSILVIFYSGVLLKWEFFIKFFKYTCKVSSIKWGKSLFFINQQQWDICLIIFRVPFKRSDDNVDARGAASFQGLPENQVGPRATSASSNTTNMLLTLRHRYYHTHPIEVLASRNTWVWCWHLSHHSCHPRGSTLGKSRPLMNRHGAHHPRGLGHSSNHSRL